LNSPVDTIDLVVAILFIVGFVFMLVRGLRARAHLSDYAYGVERQAVRHEMLVSFSRSAVMLLVAIILFAIYGVLPNNGEPEFLETETPTVTMVPTAAITQTADSSQLPVGETSTAAPVDTITPDEEPTGVPEPTETPIPSIQATTAVVESFNGLYLRTEPDAESQELELVLDGTQLFLLDGREPVGQPEWQQVRAPSGLEGWVFIQFIVYQ
jgi:hypothetical protein